MQFVFLIFSLFCFSKTESTLQFVEIWFRHGERLPTHFLNFPNEPFSKDYLELAEPGELTNRGILQEYELGTWLRERYGEFLGKYTPSEIHVWTGKDNRTVTSAQAVMAGLYPPTGGQIWNEKLMWQPVSMHTDDSLDWVSTGVEKECPSYEKKLFGSNAFDQIPSKMNQSILQFLYKKSGGAPVQTVLDVNHILDSLRVRNFLNDSRLPYPAWAEPVRDIIQSQHELMHSLVIDLQNDTVVGYVAEQVLSYMEDHLRRSQTSRNKGVFLAAHDTSFMTIGKALGIEELASTLPFYSAHLAVELHLKNGTNYVEFYFADGPNSPLKRVYPSQCPFPCKLEQLQQITKAQRVSKREMMIECKATRKIDSQTSAVTGALVFLIAILLISTVILACTTFNYRKQLLQWKDPERQRLI